MLILIACSAGLIGVNFHVRTVVGTVVSRGLVYGGVNEVASKTSEETGIFD